MADSSEKEFLGSKKSKIQTYIILGILLVIGIVIAQFALKNKDLAENGMHTFLGLPSWAFPTIAGLLGIGIFWLGLKTEADWPEAFGALLIAGALGSAEVMVGWKTFAFGGIWLLPILFPIATFLVLLMVGQAKSR